MKNSTEILLNSTVSTEKKSQASMDEAWVRRNSFHVGPVRIGEGSMLCLRRMAQTLEGARITPGPGQLAMDPSVAPGGVLTGQSEGHRTRSGGDAEAT